MNVQRSASEQVVEARPKRVRRVVIPVAAGMLVLFTVAGTLLRNTPTGAFFTVSDQVAMIGLGVLLAGAALLLLRPRVRADAAGIEVRNVVSTHQYSWDAVHGVSFPEGASWARLELPDDEYVPILAIQAFDGERAVVAMRELRHLRRRLDSADAT